MTTGTIVFVVLLGLLLLTFVKRAIFSLPKWKTVYFQIVKDLNDGEDEEKIKRDLIRHFKLTAEQANAAILAAKEGDVDWFENSIWR